MLILDMKFFENEIFNIKDEKSFEKIALEVFNFQCRENVIYNNYIQYLKIDPANITCLKNIPFLPISLFKTQKIATGNYIPDLIFRSSGTKDIADRSIHFVKDSAIYEKSFLSAFKLFYGDIENYCILALLPSYFENKNSSLIYMINCLIEKSQNNNSSFYLYNTKELYDKLVEMENENQKTILIGVSFALIDFADKYPLKLKNTIVIETGGMKGKRKELTKEELHNFLKDKFSLESVHSEYGMTEILSQAYSKENGLFYCPPWMKILVRDINDPFSYLEYGKTGGLNIIDLANKYSCSFLEAKDICKKVNDESFESHANTVAPTDTAFN